MQRREATSKILVLGGTGFLGSRVANLLGADTASRDGGDYYLGGAYCVDVLKPDTLYCLRDYDVVVNCVGLSPLRDYGERFKKVHVDGTKNIVDILDDQHYVHVSAFGAKLDVRSNYVRSKAEGEVEAFTHGNTCVIRPGLLLGEESEVNTLFRATKYLRVAPRIDLEMTWVRIERVVEAIQTAVERGIRGSYDVYDEKGSFNDMLRSVVGRHLRIPATLTWLGARIVASLGLFGVGAEQLRLLRGEMSAPRLLAAWV